MCYVRDKQRIATSGMGLAKTSCVNTNWRILMKKLILILLGAILVALATASSAHACESVDPGDSTSFE
jgi:hypothetical protein